MKRTWGDAKISPLIQARIQDFLTGGLTYDHRLVRQGIVDQLSGNVI